MKTFFVIQKSIIMFNWPHKWWQALFIYRHLDDFTQKELTLLTSTNWKWIILLLLLVAFILVGYVSKILLKMLLSVVW